MGRRGARGHGDGRAAARQAPRGPPLVQAHLACGQRAVRRAAVRRNPVAPRRQRPGARARPPHRKTRSRPRAPATLLRARRRGCRPLRARVRRSGPHRRQQRAHPPPRRRRAAAHSGSQRRSPGPPAGPAGRARLERRHRHQPELFHRSSSRSSWPRAGRSRRAACWSPPSRPPPAPAILAWPPGTCSATSCRSSTARKRRSKSETKKILGTCAGTR